MSTRSVDLSEHDDLFIESGIAEGRFSSVGEAIHAGLHLLESRQAEDEVKLEKLRALIEEGLDEIDHGEAIGFASLDDFAEYIHKLGGEVSSELAAERARA